ncbi:MAG: hypothetical protein ACJ74U_20420 [Jatrophihabitantaceae bacterium]
MTTPQGSKPGPATGGSRTARVLTGHHRLHGDSQQSLMAHTYYGLRWGLGIVTFLLPLVVRWGEKILTKHSLPESISGYYHTGMRNYFVATLIVVAAFLFLYKGYSRWENYLLNIAGVATAGVVFFPTGCDSGSTECATYTRPWLHGTFAIIAFGSIGLVAVFLGGSTLDLLHDKRKERIFRTIYLVLGVAMIVLPLLTAVLAHKDVASLYWIEFAALWVFVGYWTAKTLEFSWSHAEQKAIQGLLPPPPGMPDSVDHGLEAARMPPASDT